MTFYDKFCPSRGFKMTFYINHRNVHVHMNDGWEGEDARLFPDAGQGGEVLQPLRVWNNADSPCKVWKDAGQL